MTWGMGRVTYIYLSSWRNWLSQSQGWLGQDAEDRIVLDTYHWIIIWRVIVLEQERMASIFLAVPVIARMALMRSQSWVHADVDEAKENLLSFSYFSSSRTTWESTLTDARFSNVREIASWAKTGAIYGDGVGLGWSAVDIIMKHMW